MKRTLRLFVISMFAVSISYAGAMKQTPELLKKGETSYKTNCTICHGDKGDGNGVAGAALSPKPRNFATDKFKAGTKPEQIFNTVTKGLPGTAMASFGHLSEEERWGLTYYVLKFRSGKK